jgi:adenylylsulfate kinase
VSKLKKGFTLWFTGPPSSGKSTLAIMVKDALEKMGIKRVEILDGDEVRRYVSRGLGFSKEDRDENIRRIGWICKILTRNDVVAIGAAISPYREIRDEVRAMVGNFIEVYVKCPIEVCEERDIKGLYKRARAGEIKNFTGVNDPYEEPLNPEVICETDKETPEECLKKIMEKIEEMGYIQR